jgi:hypothetical protein
VSGEYREDERKRTTDDASLVCLSTVKTENVLYFQDESGGYLFIVQMAVGVKVA